MSLEHPESLPDQRGSDIGALRRRRLVYAVLTSGGSKVVALIVQLLALPIALRVLGVDRYASFLTLLSFVSWTGILGLGLVPTLPKFIAAARVLGDRRLERNLVVSSILVIALMSIAVFLGFAILSIFVAPLKLISAHNIEAGEIRTGYLVAAAVSSLSLLASVDPAIRAGSQELHRTSINAIIANLLTLVGLFLLISHPAQLWSFFVVLALPNALLLILDLPMIFLERPYLARGNVQFRNTAKAISSHSNNALIIQASFAMLVYLPTLAVAHLSTPHETIVFGSIAFELFFALAGMNIIFQPLAAAVANAHSHGDAKWVARSYWNSLALVSAIGLLAVATGATVGPRIIATWLGPSVQISHVQGGTFGLFFFLLCLAQMHFFVLSATGGLPKVGKLYLLQSLAGLSLGSAICIWNGAEGMALGLVLALASTSWKFPMLVRRELAAMSTTASPGNPSVRGGSR